ncbi:MAG: PqqD family protein [bacterium]
MKNTLRKDEVLYRELGDEGLVELEQEGESFILNETARLVWKMRCKGEAPERITQALVTEFAVEKSTVRKDVERVLRLFRSIGLPVHRKVVEHARRKDG